MGPINGRARRAAERETQAIALHSREQRRFWLAVVVAAALSAGAFSAQSLWPFLAPHLVSADNEKVPAPHAASRQMPSQPVVPANTPVDEKLARLGTDDVGATSPRMLHLVEALPGKSTHDGSARIGTDPRNPQTYSVGSLMLNGARLTEIFPDHVVLQRSAEKLELYLDSGGQVPSHAMSSDLLLVGGARPPPQEAQPLSVDQRHALTLTDFIRPSPVFDGDRLQGVALFQGEKADEFSRLGLAEGDVVTAVNGEVVTDAAGVVSQLEQLLAGGELNVSVRRGAKTIQLSLNGSVFSTESSGDVAALDMGQDSGQ